MSKQDTFAQYLRNQGLSFTTERRAILEQILTGPRHFQADELYIRLAQNRDKPISRATVFRTLRLLTAAGLIRKVAFVDRHSHYEHLFGHEHLICQKCGRIIEFQDQSLSRALARVCKAKKFHLASHKIEAVGLCSKCS